MWAPVLRRSIRTAPRLSTLPVLLRQRYSSSADVSKKYGSEAKTNVLSGQAVDEMATRKKDLLHSPTASIPAPELFSLSDRTTIITGGGRGLGLTIAHSLLEAGSSVVCLDLLPEPSEPQWSEALSYASSRNLSLTYKGGMDVTDQSQVNSVVSQIFNEKAGTKQPVKSLFTSAGIQLMLPALEYTPEKFRKLLDVNVTGTFLVVQAFAKEWFAAHGTEGGEEATICMTGSMSAQIANMGIEAVGYNASKAAVNSLARNLAMEWGKKGIRINTLSPGYIRTAMTANLLADKPELDELWVSGSLLGRLATPDEFRGPVVFLLSKASSFMQGSDLLVDGGHCAT